MKITIYYGTKHLNHYLNYPFNWNTIDQILLNYRCCWSKTAKKWLAIVQALVNWDTTFFIGNFNLMNKIELKLELVIIAVFDLH